VAVFLARGPGHGRTPGSVEAWPIHPFRYEMYLRLGNGWVLAIETGRWARARYVPRTTPGSWVWEGAG
jgi:hypothetical protein